MSAKKRAKFWSARPDGAIAPGAGRSFRRSSRPACICSSMPGISRPPSSTACSIARRPKSGARLGRADARGFRVRLEGVEFITHLKRLNETSRNSLDLLESRLRLLRGKVGPVLFQLPPRFTKNRERLASFFKMLRVKREYAFEFRHPSWYEDDILDLLRDNNVSLCISDHHDAPSPWVVTAEHVYVRGHGPQGRSSRSLFG